MLTIKGAATETSLTGVAVYIGRDVHEETVAVAAAVEGERGSEMRYLGPVAIDDDAIRRW